MRSVLWRNGLFVGLALLLVAPAFLHVFNTHDGKKKKKKQQISLKDTWLDLTTLSMAELRDHGDVVKLLLQKGDERYLPGGPVLRSLYDLGLDMQEALEKLDGEIKVRESLGELKKLGSTKVEELRRKADQLRR